MGLTKLEFIFFYTVFLIFVIFISGEIGITVLSAEGITAIPQPTGAWWLDWTLPFQYFWVFMTVSSENTLLFTLLILPFAVGITVVIAEMIRGV